MGLRFNPKVTISQIIFAPFWPPAKTSADALWFSMKGLSNLTLSGMSSATLPKSWLWMFSISALVILLLSPLPHGAQPGQWIIRGHNSSPTLPGPAGVLDVRDEVDNIPVLRRVLELPNVVVDAAASSVCLTFFSMS